MAESNAGQSPHNIPWKKYYSVGNPYLDDQHKEILSLICRLTEALSMNEGQEALRSIMRRLADYAHTHFQDEERMMQEANYPCLDEHKLIHKELLDKTSDHLYSCIQHNPPEAKEILLFLKSWWINHIAGEDKKYSSYLKSHETEQCTTPLQNSQTEKPCSSKIDSELEELLEALIQNEREFGLYYAALVSFIPEHAAMWLLLSQQEKHHAEVLQQIRQAVAEAPHLYSVGTYNADSVRAVTRDVHNKIGEIERQEIHPRYAVTFITDMENSLFESQLDKAVETDVAEVQDSLKKLSQETSTHRDLLHTISI